MRFSYELILIQAAEKMSRISDVRHAGVPRPRFRAGKIVQLFFAGDNFRFYPHILL